MTDYFRIVFQKISSNKFYRKVIIKVFSEEQLLSLFRKQVRK